MYRSESFAISPDRVTQGKFSAVAVSPEEMTSDYMSLGAVIDPVIQFKFSINGRDNELAFGVNHQANILPADDDSVIISVTFGQRADIGSGKDASKPLPPNTRVRFKVDFNPVLKAFASNGFYDDILGNRIFAADFKGLFIAGDTYPLNWDFENIPGNPLLRMEDPDGDGIYENELTFNVYDPSAHTSSTWKLSNDISRYPHFSSPYPLLDALHNLSLDEMVMLMEADGTFRTGEAWPGVWTRDLSYATVLALAYLDPERCIKSLMQKVIDDRIIQDTGTGGAWPVSSDRVVWALAAWEVYKYTGDREWLAKAFLITRNSLEADSKTIRDQATGLIRGESSFLDWRKQTYPLWMEPADISGSLNLGTNAAYYQALKVTGLMAQELGMTDRWTATAEELRENINRHLWIGDKGYYGQYLYGRNYRSLSPRSEALGEAFTVLFDIAPEERKESVLRNTPVSPFGITCIYPQIPGIPPYHNNGIWPFVQAFWTLANAGSRHVSAVETGMASLIRPAALFLTNKENFVAETGDFAGTEVNSDRQLWSVAAMLAMHHRVLTGIHFEDDRMEFRPVIPEKFIGPYQLDNFRYRDGTYSITVKGWGDGISSFRIDGKESPDHYIPSAMTGSHAVEITMNGMAEAADYLKVDNYTAPETPVVAASAGRISWSPVAGAVEYKITRNGQLYASPPDTLYPTNAGNATGDEKRFSGGDANVTGDKKKLSGGKSNVNGDNKSLSGGKANVTDEFQVLSVDGNGTESFLSNPVNPVSAGTVIIAEAEDFSAAAENRFPGFSGRGYVAFSMSDKRDLTVRLNAGAGTYLLRMRYANGTGPVNTDNNCGIRSLYVNGTFKTSLVFPQRGKDEWSDWGFTYPERIDLIEGVNLLTIKYEDFNRNMDGQINDFLLDRIILEKIN